MNLQNKDKATQKAMTRTILFALIILGVLYFGLMIFPNFTGAKDANMLGVFNNDEFGQYPFVLHMVTPGATFYQSIRNFAVYQYYYYGYPFFFFSALLLLPIKLILGANWAQHTQLIVGYLRQMINVLPILPAIGLMVYTQTKFKSVWRSVALGLLILILPAVTYDSLFWHPDALLALFSVLTIFFFWKDDHQFGPSFILAAICCGLAIGTKKPGFLFFVTVPVYILWSGLKNKLKAGKIVWKTILFLLVMGGVGVLSNPLLLLPMERAEILIRFKQGFKQNIFGFYTVAQGVIKWASSAAILTDSNGSLPFLALLILLQVVGLFNPKKRLMSVLILTWFVPYTLFFVLIETTMKEYYFLPVIIPLLSGADILFEQIPVLWKNPWKVKPLKPFLMKILIIAGTGLIAFQAVLFMITNVKLYRATLTREENSASLRFYAGFKQTVLNKLPGDLPLKFYHDWKAYLPAGQPHWQVFDSFDLASYSYIEQIHPDVILLERENMMFFAKPELLVNSVNSEKALQRQEFYTDAMEGMLEGYRLVYQDSFGAAFIRAGLQLEYPTIQLLSLASPLVLAIP